MGKQLTKSSRPKPSVKLGDIGSNVVISIVDIDEGLTKTVFGTNPPVPDLYPDGRPKLQDRVVGIVKSADGAKIKNQDGELVSAQHGDLVSIWLASCLLYTSPSPRDRTRSRMPSSA